MRDHSFFLQVQSAAKILNIFEQREMEWNAVYVWHADVRKCKRARLMASKLWMFRGTIWSPKVTLLYVCLETIVSYFNPLLHVVRVKARFYEPERAAEKRKATKRQIHKLTWPNSNSASQLLPDGSRNPVTLWQRALYWGLVQDL